MQRLKLNLLIFVSVASVFLTACRKEVVVNEEPQVNAGNHQTITSDVDLTLTGSATDNDGRVVAYLWSQVTGPVPATIVNPGSPSTVVKGLINGDYIFQLMATDEDGATGVDTVSIRIARATEKTLVLQPDNNPNEHMLVVWNGQNQSGNGAYDVALAGWTKDGLPLTLRMLLKFDLSSIPANATVKSANLYLWSYPPPMHNGNFTDPNFGPDNSFVIRQVTSNWAPATTGWNNQPTTTTTGEVQVPHTDSSKKDLTIDVKAIVSSQVATNNYGFFLKLNNEVSYTSRIFAGSRAPEAAAQGKEPKLVITYE